MIGPRFNFTRRAANARWSDRTCKLGTKKGTIKQAVAQALELAKTEGGITIWDGDTNMFVGFIRVSNVNFEITLITAALTEFMA